MKRLGLVLLLSALLAGFTQAVPAATPADAPAKAASQPDKADDAAKPLWTPSPAVQELGEKLQTLVGGDTADLEPQETFGTRALGIVVTMLDVARQELAGSVDNFAALPDLQDWFQHQSNSAKLTAFWTQTGTLLAQCLSVAFLAALLAELLLTPLRRHIRRRSPVQTWVRVATRLGWLALKLGPVLLFVGVASTILKSSDPSKQSSYAVMAVVTLLALLRLIRIALRFFLAPTSDAQRLVPLTTPQANYALTWLTWLSGVMLTGYTLADLGRFARMPDAVIAAFITIVGLLVVGMAITIIAQKRRSVSALLRGTLSAAQRDLTFLQSGRLWLARHWHRLAIAYLLIGFTVTTLGQGGGFVILARGTLVMLVALVGMRLVLDRVRRALAPREGVTQKGMYKPILAGLTEAIAGVVAIGCIYAGWGGDIGGLIESPWGQRVLGSAFSIVATLLVVVAIYEILERLIERRLQKTESDGGSSTGARARTLLPMVRTAANITLAVIVGMVTLSELGVNIAPLLAGAGIVGVAVGFGSQTLVKDFLTGLFIIIENSLSVGDVVSIGDQGGLVEGMSLRTVRLRDWNGSLHIVPFGEITRITNKTKDFSCAVMPVGISYDSDVGKAMRIMRDVGEDLRQDAEIGSSITGQVEVYGIDKLDDYSVNIQCRMRVRPSAQWMVQRAYYLRLKARFDAEGIAIPFPTSLQLHVPQSGGPPLDAIEKSA